MVEKLVEASGLKFDFAGRLEKLKKLVGESKAGALLLVAGEGFDANAYYYSGDETHPTIILATEDACTIFSLESEKHAGLFEEALPLKHSRKQLLAKLKKLRVKSLGVDDCSASAGSGLRLAEKLKAAIVPLGEKLSEQRVVKQPAELECVKKACEVTLHALRHAELQGFAGRTENQVAGLLEERARFQGGSLDAFPPMVLSGKKRTCLFHNSTSNKRILEGEVVLVDCGSRWGHYCADYTRSYLQKSGGGRGNAWSKKILGALEAVQQAKHAAVKKARVGVTGRQLDEIALKVIAECGWKKYSHKVAGHGIGHFIGLDVHDGGSFYKTRLRRGMAFTIEPGIYVPGEFGVRSEDTLVLE